MSEDEIDKSVKIHSNIKAFILKWFGLEQFTDQASKINIEAVLSKRYFGFEVILRESITIAVNHPGTNSSNLCNPIPKY
jgi:hypothetical protein